MLMLLSYVSLLRMAVSSFKRLTLGYGRIVRSFVHRFLCAFEARKHLTSEDMLTSAAELTQVHDKRGLLLLTGYCDLCAGYGDMRRFACDERPRLWFLRISFPVIP